jgi:hypothetical protein
MRDHAIVVSSWGGDPIVAAHTSDGFDSPVGSRRCHTNESPTSRRTTAATAVDSTGSPEWAILADTTAS